MLNIGAGEIAIILVAALLILGPKRLPEMARFVGKFVREFRRQTDDVRGLVEKEFYRMDEDVMAEPPRAFPEASPNPGLLAEADLARTDPNISAAPDPDRIDAGGPVEPGKDFEPVPSAQPLAVPRSRAVEVPSATPTDTPVDSPPASTKGS